MANGYRDRARPDRRAGFTINFFLGPKLTGQFKTILIGKRVCEKFFSWGKTYRPFQE
jgi:hypothetical protein